MPGRRDLSKRFWEKVEKRGPEDCWEWTGSKDRRGYGRIGSGVGKTVLRASRLSYAIQFGACPDGEQVCHTCDNPGCVNPAHLFLGSHSDNAADRNAKGRTAWGEGHGSVKLTAGQVLEIRAEYALKNGATMTALGEKYGVSLQAISDIISRRNWNKLPDVIPEEGKQK